MFELAISANYNEEEEKLKARFPCQSLKACFKGFRGRLLMHVFNSFENLCGDLCFDRFRVRRISALLRWMSRRLLNFQRRGEDSRGPPFDERRLQSALTTPCRRIHYRR